MLSLHEPASFEKVSVCSSEMEEREGRDDVSILKKVTKQTQNRFLNMYHVEANNRLGKNVDYYVASRAASIDELKLTVKENKPDGVIIFSLYGEKKDHVILIRQYRYTIDQYIYEFPAGLVDAGENYKMACVREMKEETGLEFHPLQVDEMYEKAFYTTIGMTDESCSMVYGYAEGVVSQDNLEENETIEVVIADRQEVRRILREEQVALPCAYMLMHFISKNEPFAFLMDGQDSDE